MASLGPLETFVFPGVITETRVQAPTAAGGGAGTRYAAVIGVGQETEEVTNSQMIRGSSSNGANVIVGENLANNGHAENVIDGVNTTFLTKFKPIVVNDGPGSFASESTDVLVTVDGVQVPVNSVNGKDGVVELVDAPQIGQLVEIAYYYKRKDTWIEGEDLSIQANGVATSFMVRSKNIVDGTNGGRYLTGKGTGTVEIIDEDGVRRAIPVFTVTVDGSVAAVSDISGSTRSFTLVTAPALGATVLVTYFTNDWQDTFDILPAAEVESISYVGRGSSPTPDWRENKDYVLLNNNEIHWGNSVAVSTGEATGGTEFGANQIQAALIDTRVHYARVATPAAAPVSSVVLPVQPVRGDGTGKPMTDSLSGSAASYDDLKVWSGIAGITGSAGTYVGPAGVTSLTEIPVSKVDGRSVTLAAAVPAGHTVWATYYANQLFDASWDVTNVTAGGAGVGEYEVKSVDNALGSTATAYQVTWTGGGTTGAELIPGTNITFLDQAESTWDGQPNDEINVFVRPSYNGTVRPDEVVTVDIDTDGTFVVTSTNPTGTGSGAISTGAVGATYVDSVTGFTISIADSLTLSAALPGAITFNVSSEFTVRSQPELGIPGVSATVATTAGVTVGDTAVIRAVELLGSGGSEPDLGDNYTVRFVRVKTDYSTKYVTSPEEAAAAFGALSASNPIMIGAYLAFANGAPALAMKQIKKAPGSSDATVADYIAGVDEFDEPLTNGTRPSLIQPLSTNPTVVSYLKSSNSKQSSKKYRNERTSYFGFRIGTTMDTVINTCRALGTEFLTAVYPDSAKITVPNNSGVDTQITVGGEYIAMAMAGADLNPARDIATPLTNITLVGFDSLGRRVKASDAELIAQSGCTMLEQKAPGIIKVLMALTTDLSGPLTRDPRIIEIKHDVQKGARVATDPFIGVKGLPGVPRQVANVVSKFLQARKNAQIIYDFKGVAAKYDDADPTVINVKGLYKPIFGVNWIVIEFSITTSLS